MSNNIPLSLYIHIPWCLKKCPYCDFNSHGINSVTDDLQDKYIAQLIADLEYDIQRFQLQDRKLISIFIGGGTPSLVKAKNIKKLLVEIKKRITFIANIEITLEANPATLMQQKLENLRLAGINRLSLGVQSFTDDKLILLGRIHNGQTAHNAILAAKKAGFNNINVDLMHGLPEQTTEEALYDLQQAISYNITHISWYQLTIEPNTVFAKYPPKLPHNERLWHIQQHGEKLLKQHNYQHYEISAFSKKQHCYHNKNYWQFGDYLGIGAGAHAKISMANKNIYRYAKLRLPKSYLAVDLQINPAKIISKQHKIAHSEIILEFMMNQLRLLENIDLNKFEQRTFLKRNILQQAYEKACKHGFFHIMKNDIQSCDYLLVNEKTRLFLNDCLELF